MFKQNFQIDQVNFLAGILYEKRWESFPPNGEVIYMPSSLLISSPLTNPLLKNSLRKQKNFIFLLLKPTNLTDKISNRKASTINHCYKIIICIFFFQVKRLQNRKFNAPFLDTLSTEIWLWLLIFLKTQNYGPSDLWGYCRVGMWKKKIFCTQRPLFINYSVET